MAIFQVSSIFAIFLPLEIEPVIHFTAETFLHTFSFFTTTWTWPKYAIYVPLSSASNEFHNTP